LEAIGTIIQKSDYRTARFMFSPDLHRLFSSEDVLWEMLLPKLQALQSRSDPYAKTFPPLGSIASQNGSINFSQLSSMDYLPARNVAANEVETPLVTWLMYIARRSQKKERLAACWILGLLRSYSDHYPDDDTPKGVRERYFSYFVVPLVVKMIEDVSPTSEASKQAQLNVREKEENRYILERAPAVLAILVKGDEKLQASAVQAKVLPVLCQILKKSFDPLITSSKPLWSPRPASAIQEDPMIESISSTLGRAGLSPDILHAFRYRESTLRALAAITDRDDPIRKKVMDLGALTQIRDSLIPYSEESGESSSPTAEKDGNPLWVVIAACKVARSLSRSVSILRTSMIDHGIAKPVYALASHSDVRVQIAATDVLINFMLEFSPEKIVSATIPIQVIQSY